MLKSSCSFKVALLMLTTMILAGCGMSHYPARLDDPKAVYLNSFGARGDGIADDSNALQAAINKVQETTRKGIVFIPEGRYRLTKTVFVWNGIRLIGWGANRPTFVLAANTPGYQQGDNKYLLHFVSDRPRPNENIRDANPGTFYSALTNINLEIQDGNPVAVGVRSHWAQHCFISHVDFHIGSGRAGVEQVGNEMEDCRFYGGDFGISTTKPSPSWPFLLIDSHFEGQRKAAIDTEEGGMTLIRDSFRNVPTAVNIHENRAEELIMKDCRLEDITGPALVISDEFNARCMINLQDVACQRVPTLANFRSSGHNVYAPAPVYLITRFTHGNTIADFGATAGIKTTIEATSLPAMPPPVASDLPALPTPDTWVNLLSLGAKGDGVTDDTAVLQQAIAAHKTIYLPTGRYLVSDTIKLQPDTVLIGLSPFSTQIFVADANPSFTGQGGWKPMIESSRGGSNILTGIGLDSGNNKGAIACKWMAGEKSYINDVKFVGGHGTYRADGSGVPAYNKDRTADGLPGRVWDTIPYSLWITDNGGGTFKDIWTANPIAQAGFCVENTSTSGRMYAISVEHHVSHEVIFRGASNFQVFALQTEEERAEGPKCLPLEITNCSNLQFNNFYFYRVNIPQPYLAGIKIKNSQNLTFRNLHTYSPGKTTYDDAAIDLDTGAYLRSREIALFTVSGHADPAPASPFPDVLAPNAKLEKLASGYENIDSLAADPAGNVYFLDAHAQKIFRYDVATRETTTLKNTPADPVAIIFDTAGNLLIFSGRGALHAMKIDGANATLITPPPSPSPATAPASAPAATASAETAPAPDLTAFSAAPMPATMPASAKAYVHPQTRWKDAHDFLIVTQELGNASPMRQSGRPFGSGPLVPPGLYTAPDGATLIPQTRDLTRAYALTLAIPGQPVYIADEFGQKTYRFTAAANGQLTKPELIAEEGECGVAADAQGNVYTAAGDIFIYDASGKPLGTIKTPERPTSIVFGGPDRQTLFIAARSSLYSVRTKSPGR